LTRVRWLTQPSQGIRLTSAEDGGSSELGVTFVTGVIDQWCVERLAVSLYTSLRGNAITKYQSVEDGSLFVDSDGNEIPRSTFIIFFHGERSRDKILKLCHSYNATIIDNELVMPQQGGRGEQTQIAQREIAELQMAIKSTIDRKSTVLCDFYNYCQEISSYVFEEKMIFFTLNKFQRGQASEDQDGHFIPNEDSDFITCHAWCPAAAFEGTDAAAQPYIHALCSTARDAAKSDAVVIVTPVDFPVDNSIHGGGPKPPTFIRVNEFTGGFQGIVDGYGIPRYEEANPGFFAIAMFPFLFGVMFGDIVHGALMIMFALGLIAKEEQVLKTYKQQNEIFLMVFDGRWTVLMCGVCACYMGFIYNEGLSIAFDMFGTAYGMQHYPETSFGTHVNATTSTTEFFDCFSGKDMGHGMYGQFGSDNCKVGSMAVSSATFGHDHANKQLYTTLFKGAKFGTNSQGVTIPSMWCANGTAGQNIYTTTNAALEGLGKVYGANGAQHCSSVYNAEPSVDPKALPPCTSTLTADCYNYKAKGFDVELCAPLVSESTCNAQTKCKWDTSIKGTVKCRPNVALLTAYDALVEVNTASQSLQHFMPYTFGVDPIWRHSDQLIGFTNSLKMKMSVIIGVGQMTFGIVLKIMNFIHAGHWSLVLAVGVPEFLFMSCTFGYMNFLIFLKWSTNYATSLGGTGPQCFDSCQCPWTGFGSSYDASENYAAKALPDFVSRTPPGIVNSMLAMFGIPSFVPGDPGKCDQWLYSEQQGIQTAFILIAVISIPWLLITEPCLVKCEHDEKHKEKETSMTATSVEEHIAAEEARGDDDDDGLNMADVVVHQAIHTIEL